MTNYTKYGYFLYEYKSKPYLEWFKAKYPNLDAHHLLRKKIDYLLFPVEHNMHLNEVHKHKAVYFDKWLKESVNIFLEYVVEKLGACGFENIYHPEKLKELFTKMQKFERGKK
jgi:hypothetical protein